MIITNLKTLWSRRFGITAIGLILMASLLTGCGEKGAQAVPVPEVSDVSEENDTTGRSETPKQEETQADLAAQSVKDETAGDYEFSFVDVFGVSYDTVIDASVPMHDYDPAGFCREGEKLFYKGDPKYKSRLGIDVSYHQGKINWEKVAADGYEFVFIRVAYRGYGQAGTLKEDKLFAEYYQGARDAGLDVGVYIFSQAINEKEALEEADFVIGCLGDRTLQLPVVYDPESILDDVARTDSVTGEQFTANTMTFCKRIEEAGFKPMVYSNMLWEAFQFEMAKTSIYPYWYADYEAQPQTPYGFEFWQYSNTGRVSGIGTQTDLDIQLIPIQ